MDIMSRLETLSKESKRSLWGYAYTLMRTYHGADDLLQDTYLRAMEQEDKFKEGNYYGWLKVVMYHIFVSQYRQRMRRNKQFHEHMNSGDIEKVHYDEYIDPTIRPEILKAVKKIRPERRVLLYDAGEDLSYREIAKKRDIPLGTVMSRLSRGRAEAREALKELELELV